MNSNMQHICACAALTDDPAGKLYFMAHREDVTASGNSAFQERCGAALKRLSEAIWWPKNESRRIQLNLNFQITQTKPLRRTPK